MKGKEKGGGKVPKKKKNTKHQKKTNTKIKSKIHCQDSQTDWTGKKLLNDRPIKTITITVNQLEM